MPDICNKCHQAHPPGIAFCEEAKAIRTLTGKNFLGRVAKHKSYCRGCPDPEQHVRILDGMNNPPKEPLRFAKEI